MPSANGPSFTPSKPFSISLKSKDRPKSSLLNSVSAPSSKKRPHSALADPDSDNEESRPDAVTVTAFDSGKAVSADSANAKTPLIIQAEKNRDWRAEGRKKRSKNTIPAEERAAQDGRQGSTGGDVERVEVSQEAGLKITTKNDKDGDVAMSEDTSAAAIKGSSPERTQTADEEALAALLGAEKKSSLTIPTVSEGNGVHNNGDLSMDQSYHTNEDERFRADVASRPEPASLADYANIPIEEFGKAALRGMGWKEGDPIGKRRVGSSSGGAGVSEFKPREVKRRPALLGIGAKEVPGGVSSDVELGAWGVGAKGRRTGGGQRGKAEAYNPVMLKNADTGEMITEEELELRKAEARVAREKGREATGEEGWRQRRDRNLANSSRKRSQDLDDERRQEHGGSSSRRKRSRSAERRDEHDASSSSSRRRHRSRSKERHGHRHGFYDGDGDGGTSRRDRSGSTERRHRRSERGYDHDGRRERDREKGGDRERNRDVDRHRDRDRDRDSHRDRDREYRRR